MIYTFVDLLIPALWISFACRLNMRNVATFYCEAEMIFYCQVFTILYMCLDYEFP